MGWGMLIAQISDLHVSTADPDHKLVDTSETLRRVIDVLNTMRPRPDCVIATGDLVDHGTDVEYRILFSILERLELPLYLLPGNHDNAPLLRMHLHMHGMLRADEAGHLGTVIDTHDVRLVLVDTTDPTRHDGVFPEARAAWLDRVLQADTRPTLVAMHHPPFATGIWWMDVMGIERGGRTRFESVVRKHPHVRQIVSGHVHRSIARTWGVTMLTVCPSTAHQVGLSLGDDAAPTLTLEAPSFQLHRWSDDGFVTNTTPIELPGVFDLRSQVSDWEATKERLTRGGPFPKDEPLF